MIWIDNIGIYDVVRIQTIMIQYEWMDIEYNVQQIKDKLDISLEQTDDLW